MSGFCGWFALDENDGESVSECLHKMGDGLPPMTRQDREAISAPGAIFARPSSPQSALILDDGVIGAIDGRPDWHEPRYSAIANKMGHAHAAISAYRDYGQDLLNNLSGEFSLAILDSGQRRLLLAVDRLGSRPLAYAKTGSSGIVFGSSVESVRRHPLIKTSLNQQAIFDYLYFHQVPSPQSIYREIHKLQPGERLWMSAGYAHAEAYWNPSFTEQSTESGSSMEKALRESLSESVRNRLVNGTTATFLSGGLDSSTIAGIAARERPQGFRAYTMGFDAAGYDEMHYARLAARHFGIELREYYVTQQDIIDMMPVIASEYDEPFGNSSAIPTLLCARLARSEGVEYLLAGDGGDELFGGNERYAKQRLFEVYTKLPALLRDRIFSPLIRSMPSRFPFTKAKSFYAQVSVPMPGRMETYNFLNRQPITEILDSDFIAQVDPAAPLDRQRDRYENAKARSLINKMIWLDWKFTLADNDFRKVSHTCELAGTDVTFPFMDQQLIELSLRMPPGQKVHGRRLRHLYKNAFHDFLPKEIINKEKHWFGLPFGVWLATSKQMQDFIYTLLSGLATRQIITRPFADSIINANRSDHAAFYGNIAYVLAMLELWLTAHDHELCG